MIIFKKIINQFRKWRKYKTNIETINIDYTYNRRSKCYNADCNDCPGLFITHTGNFESFKKYVQESLDFYIECAKQDGDVLYWVFEDDIPYKLEFRKYAKLH